MKKIRVAVNGFGRIGRAFAKIAKDRPELELVAVNDLGSLENFAYLLKYDTAYGVSPFEVSVDEKKNVIDHRWRRGAIHLGKGSDQAAVEGYGHRYRR